MSTRAMITYIDDMTEDFENTGRYIYQHSDGYPEYLGRKVEAFLSSKGASARFHDGEYLMAWLLWYLIEERMEEKREWDKLRIERGEEPFYNMGEKPLDNLNDLTGFGMSTMMHCDIEYLYVIVGNERKLMTYDTYEKTMIDEMDF